MFLKSKIAVDIGSRNIKILVGDKTKIKHYGLINTPVNSYVDSRPVNTAALSKVIGEFLIDDKINTKNISFTIHGQDVIVRHVEIPVMDNKALKNSVNWEICQYLPQNGDNYYIDFQILDKLNNGEKKVYNILVVAVPKEKVNKYIEISESLNLNIDSIDISSNCIARVFNEHFKKNSNSESIGIIHMGSNSSSIVILDSGMLNIEKEVNTGLRDIIEKALKDLNLNLDYDHALDYLKTDFDLNKIDVDKETDIKIKALYDSIFYTFEKTIQFYTSGKTKKNLDRIYLTGSGSRINGLTDYLKTYFNSNVHYINSIEDLSLKIINNISFEESRLFINVLGLLIRKG